jgi:hypothetical protein
MTVPARVKEADIMRALRAARKAGAKRVKVGADGSIDIMLEDDNTDERLPTVQPEPPQEIKTLW